ncbi:MAG: MGDG synthase family glycosyltransferase [Eubacterium sp.]
MKVLILTGAFGNGHVSASEALRQQIESGTEGGSDVEIIDIVQYLFPHFSRVIYGVFNLMAGRFSGVYNAFNKIDERSSGLPMKRLFIKKFKKIADPFSPDLLIATLPISARYLGAYKEYEGNRIPCITCITDIYPHREWLYRSTDAYLVGDERSKEAIVKKGVDPEKIFVGGIPVKKEFRSWGQLEQNISRVAHTAGASGAGKSSAPKNVLVMGGGLGLIPGIDAILDSFGGEPDVSVTVLCGKNEKLRKKLSAEYPGVNAVGYVTSAAEYLKKADLIVTKAGGITTFEAISAGTPMAILPPFLEQEQENALFVQRNGFGRMLPRERSEWGRTLRGMINDDRSAAEMRANMRRFTALTEESGILTIIEKTKAKNLSKVS